MPNAFPKLTRRAALTGALALTACGPAPRAPQTGAVTFPRFADADPYPWEGRSPSDYAIHGTDVSRFQTAVDWRQAKAAGISFAFVKATEGGDLLDPMFENHWRGAGRAGIRRGAYHFFYHCRPAEEQARWFIRHVPRNSNDLPHVLDMEWTPFSPTCTIRRPGAELRAEALRFLDILERHYGKRPIVYTSVDFYRDTDIGRLPGTEFWLRSVAGHPRDTYAPGARWTFWQYTSTGLVPGMPGEVDINVFRGSPAAWQGWGRQGRA